MDYRSRSKSRSVKRKLDCSPERTQTKPPEKKGKTGFERYGFHPKPLKPHSSMVRKFQAVPPANVTTKAPRTIIPSAAFGEREGRDCRGTHQDASSFAPTTPLSPKDQCSYKTGELLQQQKSQRRRMDCSTKMQCTVVLDSLMGHRGGGFFIKLVDPSSPDYFDIISEPMDLGTVQSKLNKDMYSYVGQFAADVRLTFYNLMLSHRPSDKLYEFAWELIRYFEKLWKSLLEKWEKQMKKDTGHQDGTLMNDDNACLNSCLASASATKKAASERSSFNTRKSKSVIVLSSKKQYSSCGTETATDPQRVVQEKERILSKEDSAARRLVKEDPGRHRKDENVCPNFCLTGSFTTKEEAASGRRFIKTCKSKTCTVVLSTKKQYSSCSTGTTDDPRRAVREKERKPAKEDPERILPKEDHERILAKEDTDRDRKACRLALEKMNKTVEIDSNSWSVKELEILCGHSLEYYVVEFKDGSKIIRGAHDITENKHPLKDLGLFLKDERVSDDEEAEILGAEELEGEIPDQTKLLMHI